MFIARQVHPGLMLLVQDKAAISDAEWAPAVETIAASREGMHVLALTDGARVRSA